ncbi:MarR family transcriptional regulator, partial [Bacillus seohaeanensis]
MGKNNIADLEKASEKAKRNARKRDFDLEKLQYALDHAGIPQEQMENALAMLSKATGKEHYIGTKKSPQSKVRFAQILQENMKYLSKEGYLTLSEKGFLMDIIPYVSFHSNSIVYDIKGKNPVPMNISELASELGRARQKTSQIVNGLVKKGILAKAESGIEGNNAKAYSLFVNPHVIFAGDKDNVPEHLQVIFYKAMKQP